MSKLADIRREFSGIKLDEAKMPKAPLEFFETWLNNALDSATIDANAFVLASVDEFNQPQLRVLLLKEFSEAGFVFYTNFASAKGKDLHLNPKASMLFFWQDLARQVKINGLVEKLPDERAQKYFATRPRTSKIGALASNQSSRVTREELEASFAAIEAKYAGVDTILKPNDWGGYLLKPNYFEFWQGQQNRFHDRICYKKSQSSQEVWEIFRLAP